MAAGRWLRYCSMGAATVAAVLAFAAPRFAAAQSTADTEWRHFGHDAANTKYSPLDQITPENFTDLEIAWRWTSISTEVTRERAQIRPGPFKSVSLMAGGLVYLSTSLGQVAALDAGTGALAWSYDPRSYDRLDRPGNMGWQHRGVSYWEDDASDDARIFIATHDLLLVALNARTGAQYANFGADGAVDLSTSLGRRIDRARFTHSQPLAIAGDTVIVGSIVQDTNLTRREADPGHVRGFDARTGEMKWIFHTIPQGEEFGADTWHNESWRYSGHSNVWGTMAVDEELGYVYLPTGTPTNDWYGGMRPGDNLFAESIICVDAETGERIWHFQAVHHGLWDYDFPNRRQPARHHRRRAPDQGDRPVEQAGVHLRLRPDHRRAGLADRGKAGAGRERAGRVVLPDAAGPDEAAAVRSAGHHRRRPRRLHAGASGGGDPHRRPGAARPDLLAAAGSRRGQADHPVARSRRGASTGPAPRSTPETGRLFIPSQTRLRAVELVAYPPPATVGYFTDPWAVAVPGPRGLPLVKPPYKRVTAIDLNTGDRAWMAPHGDGPRNHPAIRHLNLPALGGHVGMHGGGPLVTKTLLIVNSGARYVEDEIASASAITAYHKDNGDYLGSVELPAIPYGNPITYLHEGKQYIVVAVGTGSSETATPELIALALP